jgi:PKHD-type hydroxylase
MAKTPNYIFSPSLATNFKNHVEYVEYLSPPECQAVIELGRDAPEQDATITAGGVIHKGTRDSRIHWIECNNKTLWLWNKLASLANMANKNYFCFDLLGFRECAQFTCYDGEGAHYDWHMDYGIGHMSQRKLSITIQLTDPSTYEGGDLELFYRSLPVKATKGVGTAVVFPSYTMHRVTPIISGVRESLVIWVSGHSTYR